MPPWRVLRCDAAHRSWRHATGTSIVNLGSNLSSWRKTVKLSWLVVRTLESVTMRCGSSVVTSRYWHFYCQLGVQFVFLAQTNCLPAAGWTEKIQLTCCRRRRRLAGHVYAFIAYDVIRRGSYVIHPWTAASVAVRRHAADGDRQSTQYFDRDWFWKQSKKLGNRPHLVIPLSGIAC